MVRLKLFCQASLRQGYRQSVEGGARHDRMVFNEVYNVKRPEPYILHHEP